ncbi:hypothetical protein DFS33DRAFT_473990 [Desarmillaria ectypa]|nr:hypothetical protein DFS33DRAFT_473990 [Desarmillaria ectypa]
MTMPSSRIWKPTSVFASGLQTWMVFSMLSNLRATALPCRSFRFSTKSASIRRYEKSELPRYLSFAKADRL